MALRRLELPVLHLFEPAQKLRTLLLDSIVQKIDECT